MRPRVPVAAATGDEATWKRVAGSFRHVGLPELCLVCPPSRSPPRESVRGSPAMHRFACGSLHREVAVGNPPRPGDENSTDPDKLVDQRYVTTEQDGGFLRIEVEADARLRVEIINQGGDVKYVYEARRSCNAWIHAEASPDH